MTRDDIGYGRSAAGLGDWIEAACDSHRIGRRLAFANCYLRDCLKMGLSAHFLGGTGPFPHPATQREYPELGGRVGERAGNGIFKRTLSVEGRNIVRASGAFSVADGGTGPLSRYAGSGVVEPAHFGRSSSIS